MPSVMTIKEAPGRGFNYKCPGVNHVLGMELAQPPEQSRCVQSGRWSGQAGRTASPVRGAHAFRGPGPLRGAVYRPCQHVCFQRICVHQCFVFFKKKPYFGRQLSCKSFCPKVVLRAQTLLHRKLTGLTHSFFGRRVEEFHFQSFQEVYKNKYKHFLPN